MTLLVAFNEIISCMLTLYLYLCLQNIKIQKLTKQFADDSGYMKLLHFVDVAARRVFSTDKFVRCAAASEIAHVNASELSRIAEHQISHFQLKCIALHAVNSRKYFPHTALSNSFINSRSKFMQAQK